MSDPGRSAELRTDRRGTLPKRKRAEIINEAKNVPCMRCGHKHPPFVMQFHHVNPSQKRPGSGSQPFDWKTIPLSELQRELDKCIVVCANCHCYIEEEIRVRRRWA